MADIQSATAEIRRGKK